MFDSHRWVHRRLSSSKGYDVQPWLLIHRKQQHWDARGMNLSLPRMPIIVEPTTMLVVHTCVTWGSITFRRAGFSICVHCWLSAIIRFWQGRRARQTLAWITLFSCILVRRPALIRLRPYPGRSEAGGEDSMRFPMSACKHWHKKQTRVNGCLLGEHPFDGKMILN